MLRHPVWRIGLGVGESLGVNDVVLVGDRLDGPRTGAEGLDALARQGTGDLDVGDTELCPAVEQPGERCVRATAARRRRGLVAGQDARGRHVMSDMPTP